MSSPQVRVRFAPSPTGFFHIGSARTALFNWLYARHCGGTFVLRIEDTDAERNTDEALEVLLSGMRWLGLDWDEGPEMGGDHGPYFQSQRSGIYGQYIEKLMATGRAYELDGAVFFRLEGKREKVFDEYLEKEIEKVDGPAVRFMDVIRGEVVRKEDRDFVIYRSDGTPTFHFANVVDDLEMGITHVVRGEDHLSNTSKHVALFEALGAPVPVFAHLPLILKDPSMGKGKMSKRDRGALIEEYRQRNFLPVAVRNALALLGWNPKDDREVLDIGEIIEKFDLADVQKGAARFDEKKMAHINFEHLKALPVESYAWFARPVLGEAGLIGEDFDEDRLQRILGLCQQKITSLEALPEFAGYFFRDAFDYDNKVETKLRKRPDIGDRLKQVEQLVAGIGQDDWSAASLGHGFDQLAKDHGEEKPFGWWPVARFAVSGVGGGPDFLPMLAIMGKETVLRRIRVLRERWLQPLDS